MLKPHWQLLPHWECSWYEPFDLSNDALEPANFYQAREFGSKREADAFTASLPSGSIDVTVSYVDPQDDE